MAVGRAARTRGLGLEALGVAARARLREGLARRWRPSVKGIYAIGDMAGNQLLAHKAMAEGVVAAEAIAGRVAPPGGLRQRAVLHVLPAPGRLDRPHRGEGPRERPRDRRRQVPVHRQRQGGGPRRDRGLPQGRGRQGHRRDPGRAHRRARGDRADPRVRAWAGRSRPRSRRSSTPSTPIPTLSEAALEATLAALGQAIHI